MKTGTARKGGIIATGVLVLGGIVGLVAAEGNHPTPSRATVGHRADSGNPTTTTVPPASATTTTAGTSSGAST